VKLAKHGKKYRAAAEKVETRPYQLDEAFALLKKIAAAGVTTPEFQLTSDTTVAFQMNFLEGGVLSNSSNTNGLSSFNNGGGAIVIDVAPWMTSGYTSNAGIPAQYLERGNRLCGSVLVWTRTQ